MPPKSRRPLAPPASRSHATLAEELAQIRLATDAPVAEERGPGREAESTPGESDFESPQSITALARMVNKISRASNAKKRRHGRAKPIDRK